MKPGFAATHGFASGELDTSLSTTAWSRNILGQILLGGACLLRRNIVPIAIDLFLPVKAPT